MAASLKWAVGSEIVTEPAKAGGLNLWRYFLGFPVQVQQLQQKNWAPESGKKKKKS